MVGIELPFIDDPVCFDWIGHTEDPRVPWWRRSMLGSCGVNSHYSFRVGRTASGLSRIDVLSLIGSIFLFVEPARAHQGENGCHNRREQGPLPLLLVAVFFSLSLQLVLSPIAVLVPLPLQFLLSLHHFERALMVLFSLPGVELVGFHKRVHILLLLLGFCIQVPDDQVGMCKNGGGNTTSRAAQRESP